MNVLKHMEAVFVATLVLAVSASAMLDAVPDAVAATIGAAPVTPSASAAAGAVVTVSAKRMTAAEKAQSLREEQIASNAARPADRM